MRVGEDAHSRAHRPSDRRHLDREVKDDRLGTARRMEISRHDICLNRVNGEAIEASVEVEWSMPL